MNKKEEGRKKNRDKEKERQGGFPPLLLVCVACVSLSPSLSLSLFLSFFPSLSLLQDIYPKEKKLCGESHTKISF
jgi:hypothetical protein